MKKTTPKSDFLALSLSTPLVAAINKIGYKTPTYIQLKTIPKILAGNDVLVRADTGSGKTAAFALPILEALCNPKLASDSHAHKRIDGYQRASSNCVQILVLVPTHELATQIAGVFTQFAANIKPRLTCLSVYGGVKINPQMMALRGGTDILVATPGRLLDLVRQKAIKFNQIKTLVVDEVDRLLRGDFQDEIKQIMKLLPNKRQNLMFTATFPDSIRNLVRQVMKQPEIINIDEVFEPVTINHRVIAVNHNKKNELLAYLLNNHDWAQVLIFCSAKRTCDNLIIKLEKRGIKAVAMHGNKEQSARSAALASFKSGQTRILIATDVAARGLDIEQLPCVINFDPPRSPNDYKHRTGRTGRSGLTGLAISLIAHHEYHHFTVIENHNGLRLPREQFKGFEPDEVAPPMPVRSRPQKKTQAKNKATKRRRPGLKPDNDNTEEEAVLAINADIWGRL